MTYDEMDIFYTVKLNNVPFALSARSKLTLYKDLVDDNQTYPNILYTWGIDDEVVTSDNIANGPGKSKGEHTEAYYCNEIVNYISR